MIDAPLKEKKYVLEWFPIVQMLGDPEFYRYNPCFLHLAEHGQAIYLQVVEKRKAEAESGKASKGCGSCTAKSHAGPLILAFVSHAHLLFRRSMEYHQDLRLLAGIREYLATKLDFVPKPVVLYYRGHGDKPEKLEIN